MQLQRGFGGGNKGAEELHHGSRRVARRVPPALPESQHLRENRVTALVRGAPFTFAARKFPSTVVLFLGPVSWQMADLLERVRASLAGRYVRAAAPSDGPRSVTAAAPHFVGSSVAWPPTCCQRPFRFTKISVMRRGPGTYPFAAPRMVCRPVSTATSPKIRTLRSANFESVHCTSLDIDSAISCALFSTDPFEWV